MSCIDSILALKPTDDAGAQTADRYEWQAAMAAADGLAAYAQHQAGDLAHLDASEIRIICEYHEDWLIQLGLQAELVSAKHRERRSGPWKSIHHLVSDGGLGHLFARWLMVERRASARLVSNAPTAPGEAADLAECCDLLSLTEANKEPEPAQSEKLERCLDAFCRALMMYRKDLPNEWQALPGARASNLVVPDELTQAARGFLSVLRIEQDRPERSLLSHAAPSLYVQPIVSRLGQPTAVAIPVWEAVLQIFRVRMRARGATQQGGLPLVGPVSQVQLAADNAVEARTVTLRDIELAVETAIAHPTAYAPTVHPGRFTKLGVKMATGGCADTSIERAEQLKLDYSRYRRERRNSVPGSSAELQSIERLLHRIADEETQKTLTGAEPWGSNLWFALSQRLGSTPSELAHYQLDGDLGLGGICELAARCRVWFSAHFDVDAAIANAKQSRGNPL